MNVDKNSIVQLKSIKCPKKKDLSEEHKKLQDNFEACLIRERMANQTSQDQAAQLANAFKVLESLTAARYFG